MEDVTLKEQIHRIWNATNQDMCITYSHTFFKNLLVEVDKLYTGKDFEPLLKLLENCAEKNYTFPFLRYVRYGEGIKKLSILQHTLNNIKDSLISFITHKFQMTAINPATLDQFLYFTQTVEPVSERLFMSVIPEYMKQNKKYLIPEDFEQGLYQALYLDEKDFTPYLSVVTKIIDEYEHDFLSLNNYTLYPLKDILFHHAQKSILEEKYLLLYTWNLSYDGEKSRDLLVKTSIPPYLYSFFLNKESSRNNFPHTIQLLAALSEKADREGLLSLEDDIEGIQEAFVLKTGLQLIVNGADHKLIQSLVDDKIEASLHLFQLMQKIIIRGLLSIYLGDNPAITEDIMRSITMNIHNEQIEEMIILLTRYSQKARLEGILALEDELAGIENLLLKQGIHFLVSGLCYDYALQLLTALSERLLEEKKLYYAIVKSGIVHLISGTPARTIEKHLNNMVPFLGCADRMKRVEQKKKYLIELIHKLINRQKAGQEGDGILYTLHNLFSTITEYKAGLIGFYTYYTSYFTGDTATLDVDGLNSVFSQNCAIAKNVIADKDEIPVFILPLEYKNELLSQISGLEKIHSYHNDNLKEKLDRFSKELDTLLTTTMISLKKKEAEKNPSIDNLSYLSEEDKIIRFLKGLGELHKTETHKYTTLFTELAHEFLQGITTLSKEIFSFVPDFSGVQETPHLSLTLILQIILKNDFLITKIDTIFPEDIANTVRNRFFPFHNIVYISDKGIKKILSQVSIKELMYALKSSDTYIRDTFFKNMSESKARELKEHLEFSSAISNEHVTEARNRIIMFAFKLEEMTSYLAFQSIKKKCISDTFFNAV